MSECECVYESVCVHECFRDSKEENKGRTAEKMTWLSWLPLFVVAPPSGQEDWPASPWPTPQPIGTHHCCSHGRKGPLRTQTAPTTGSTCLHHSHHSSMDWIQPHMTNTIKTTLAQKSSYFLMNCIMYLPVFLSFL